MPAWGVGGTDDDVDDFQGGDMRVLMLESSSQRAWRSPMDHTDLVRLSPRPNKMLGFVFKTNDQLRKYRLRQRSVDIPN